MCFQRWIARGVAGQRGTLGLLLLLAGELLILARVRPLSDFYFPLVWLGYILLLDAALELVTGRSLYTSARWLFLGMFPVSAAFWWLFEVFNEAVHSWVYVGAGAYRGMSYVAFASLDFSFVLPAVWTSALLISSLLPESKRQEQEARVPATVLGFMLAAGTACLLLPLIYPRYSFGLVWGCMYLLLDPINCWLDRPSIVAAIWRGNWRLPLSFAFGALMCGFFWEAWNYWSLPRWVYTIPYVTHWHIFAMPLPGWLGYLPFGLELFAMANFVFPLLGLGTVTLTLGDQRDRAWTVERATSAT